MARHMFCVASGDGGSSRREIPLTLWFTVKYFSRAVTYNDAINVFGGDLLTARHFLRLIIQFYVRCAQNRHIYVG